MSNNAAGAALLLAASLAVTGTASAQTPREIVHESLETMGGESALRSIAGIRLSGIEQRSAVMWSPVEAQPRVAYELFDETRSFRDGRRRRDSKFRGVNNEEPLSVRLIVADGKAAFGVGSRLAPGNASHVEAAERALASDPLQVLLHALDAGDLASLPDTVVHGERHHVVAWNDEKVRAFVNVHTGMLDRVERLESFKDDPAWTAWGDVRTTTVFSSWSLEPGGLRYPRTWTETRNDHEFRTVSITRFEVLEVLPDDSLAVPDRVAGEFSTGGPLVLGNGRGDPVEIDSGVVLLPGAWNSLLVAQSDGVVVIEAPHSVQYSRLVIREARRRFPDRQVKAVVSTDFMWAHVAGIREYVARDIPIFAAELNTGLLRQIAQAPHQLEPDSLFSAPQRVRLTPVADRFVLGSGPREIQLYVVNVPGGDYGPRMLAAYIPESGVLYGSDLMASPRNEAAFVEQHRMELVQLVRREGLDVTTVIGIHGNPTSWSDVVRELVQAGVAASPDQR